MYLTKRQKSMTLPMDGIDDVETEEWDDVLDFKYPGRKTLLNLLVALSFLCAAIISYIAFREVRTRKTLWKIGAIFASETGLSFSYTLLVPSSPLKIPMEAVAKFFLTMTCFVFVLSFFK
ncbi:hypothetical protein TVAG_235100 [Trichomonas vaginalis G3]|uniref:Uncharacterized protein n=1 Tax=Trichomonas vaginalis (strain ATCC PRA-98 / G3) TaxID=412133 RepID=A2DPM9_TRIV3|nr:hypothetical protein TVAGG3_0935140 [Trichomonas vaginalis G3]EAY17629.1 hypothetical protein TVAG_235100 [Trichomonas vaginalis G3]KAI5486126.1 hypothetical protein TVAGG3_0935140 [Trichomonas vaginalis G3]|eukprot:XP_001329764.1 hypothetical protein [Trichomonas vaginalis G3]